MITRISNEQPFQVLTSAFSISPSNSGYNLEISADGVNYSPLFTVGAGVTRLVTGVAANSFYRLKGNTSEVSINWMKTCVTEGGGGDMSNYYTKQETDAAISSSTSPIQEQLDDVAADINEAFSAITETQQVASAGLNILQGQISDLSGNTYTRQETDAEISAATSPIQEQLDDVERVTASALTELHNDILDLSGATPDMSNYYTKSEVDTTISGATSDMKTYVDNRIDGYDSAVTLTTASTNNYLRMEGSTVCTAGDIAWQALGRPLFFTTNIQQYEIGNAPYDPGLGTVNYLKFYYVGETDSMGAFTGVYYALPANGEFVEGVPVQLTRTTSVPSTVYNTPAGAGSGYFIWDNVNLTITWKSQPVIEQHVPGVVKSDGEITKVKKVTQAEYDAITTPDASTLYIIINN